MIIRSRNKIPGPGDYVWQDSVHLDKPPLWSIVAPDRRNLDMMVNTWTPAPTSNAQRAPDPGRYDVQKVSRNGRFSPPMWSWERNSARPCLHAKSNAVDTLYKVPSA